MQGTLAHVQIARQNSGNVATTVMTSFHPIPFISESLITAIADLGMDTLRARFDEGPTVQGLLAAQGDIVFRPHPEIMPAFLYGVTGTLSSTTIGSGYAANRHISMPIATQWDNDLTLPPWTIEVFKDGSINAHQFTDAQLNRLTLEIAGGQLLRGTANYMARVSSLKAVTTPTYRAGAEFTWNQASVSLGGAAWPNFESLTFAFDNALEFVALLDGNQMPKRILRGGFRTLRVTGTIDIPVNSITGLFPDFRAGTERTLVVTVEAGAVGSGYNLQLQVDVPTFRYSAWPVAVGGPGRVTVGIDGKAVYNTGSSALYMLTCINSRVAF